MDIIIDNDNNKELSCDINIDSDIKNITTLFFEKRQQGYKFRFDLPSYTNVKYTIDLTCRTLYDLSDVSYAIKAKTSPQIIFFHNDTPLLIYQKSGVGVLLPHWANNGLRHKGRPLLMRS